MTCLLHAPAANPANTIPVLSPETALTYRMSKLKEKISQNFESYSNFAVSKSNALFYDAFAKLGGQRGTQFVFECLPAKGKIDDEWLDDLSWGFSLLQTDLLSILRHYYQRGNRNAKVLALLALEKILSSKELTPYLLQVLQKPVTNSFLNVWLQVAKKIEDPLLANQILAALENVISTSTEFRQYDFLVKLTNSLLERKIAVDYELYQKINQKVGQYNLRTAKFLANSPDQRSKPAIFNYFHENWQAGSAITLAAKIIKNDWQSEQPFTAEGLLCLFSDDKYYYDEKNEAVVLSFFQKPENSLLRNQVEDLLFTEPTKGHDEVYISDSFFTYQFLLKTTQPEQLLEKILDFKQKNSSYLTKETTKMLTAVSSELYRRLGQKTEAEKTSLELFQFSNNSIQEEIYHPENPWFVNYLAKNPTTLRKIKEQLAQNPDDDDFFGGYYLEVATQIQDVKMFRNCFKSPRRPMLTMDLFQEVATNPDFLEVIRDLSITDLEDISPEHNREAASHFLYEMSSCSLEKYTQIPAPVKTIFSQLLLDLHPALMKKRKNNQWFAAAVGRFGRSQHFSLLKQLHPAAPVLVEEKDGFSYQKIPLSFVIAKAKIKKRERERTQF